MNKWYKDQTDGTIYHADDNIIKCYNCPENCGIGDLFVDDHATGCGIDLDDLINEPSMEEITEQEAFMELL